ncbi:unnamed protein product [Ostreobium quekettii]|uniref:Uncharacterized protein n=1 Tax=Ostreobium quekettii TaxID=121088 RepID=A0A8S1IXQ6_9CHLO|nr:unnamed protein product [Ostreobium quekettii]
MSQRLQALQVAVEHGRLDLGARDARIEALETAVEEGGQATAVAERARQEAVARCAEQAAALREEVGALAADNDVLRGEVAAHARVKQSTAEKLERVRRKLGLTATESQHFVQELDAAKSQNAELQVFNTQLVSENDLLKQQCNQHSRHCLMLIKENHRMMGHLGRLKGKLQNAKEHSRGLFEVNAHPKVPKKAKVGAARKQQGFNKSCPGDALVQKVLLEAAAFRRRRQQTGGTGPMSTETIGTVITQPIPLTSGTEDGNSSAGSEDSSDTSVASERCS